MRRISTVSRRYGKHGGFLDNRGRDTALHSSCMISELHVGQLERQGRHGRGVCNIRCMRSVREKTNRLVLRNFFVFPQQSRATKFSRITHHLPVTAVGLPLLLSSLLVTTTTLPARTPVSFGAPAPAPAAALVPRVPVAVAAILASVDSMSRLPIPAATSRVVVPGPAILLPTSAHRGGLERCTPPVLPQSPRRRRLSAVIFVGPGRGVLLYVRAL